MTKRRRVFFGEMQMLFHSPNAYCDHLILFDQRLDAWKQLSNWFLRKISSKNTMNLMILGQNDLILVSFFIGTCRVVVGPLHGAIWIWSKASRCLSVQVVGSCRGPSTCCPHWTVFGFENCPIGRKRCILVLVPPSGWRLAFFRWFPEPSGTRDTPDDFCHDITDFLSNY